MASETKVLAWHAEAEQAADDMAERLENELLKRGRKAAA